MTMPNFLVIGLSKCGTTALYYYLKQHPQIYMSPVKEPFFFAFEGEKVDFRGPGDQKTNSGAVTHIEAYRALFRGVSSETAIGEASAIYLYSPKAPQRIRHYIPDAKLIALLRDPVERAYSSFLHMIREGREPLTDFTQALEEEKKRIQGNWVFLWHYKQMGFYYTQLKRYFDTFDRNQIRVYLSEDLKATPLSVLQDIFRFLNVGSAFVPDISASGINVSGIPQNRALHALYLLLRKPNPIKSLLKPFIPEGLPARLLDSIRNRNLVKPPLPPEVRKQVIEVYREDILKLQDLIQRDLSAWLK